MQQGPGVVKVRRTPAVSRRVLRLAAVHDGWWTALLDEADVVSEGEVSEGADGSVYYGSTNLRCLIDSARLRASFGGVPAAEELALLILGDAHARLRLLRLARREACSRASGSIEVMFADISAAVAHDEDARPLLVIDIDVNANVAAAVRDEAGDGGS